MNQMRNTSRAKRAEIRMRKRVIADILQSVPEYIKRVKCDTNDWTQPFKCAVISCRNVFKKNDPNMPYRFHNFPIALELRRKWLSQCRLKDSFNLRSAFAINSPKVCTDHFLPDDYERNFKEELTNPAFKRKLKGTAIPSQLLGGAEVTIAELTNKSDDEGTCDTVSQLEVKKAVDENKSLEERLKQLAQQKRDILRQINSMDLATNIKKKKISALRRKIKILEKGNTNSEKSILNRVFSRSQIDVLMGKKRKVIWSNEDMARAFTLRHMGSRECYLYLRDTLNIPLPSLGSVQKWATVPVE